MINASLKNPIVEGNLTILEMMYEMDKLREENEQLLIENKRLHNVIEDKYEESSKEEDLSYIDEYAKGNAEWDNYSLPKELDWNYKA